MAEPKENLQMEKIVSLCKRRGFIFQSSEIYGGINGFWDYGPLGAELKRNLRDAWWHTMMRDREDCVGLDASIIMHRAVWKASGHVDTFADMMRACPLTKKLVRADQVEPQSGTVVRYSAVYRRQKGEKKYFHLIEEFATSLTTKEALEKLLEGQVTDAEAAENMGASLRNVRPDVLLTAKKGIASADAEAALFKGFSVLLEPGKPVESARKTASQFYTEIECADFILLGERVEKIENSIDFHPESRVELTEARPFNLMLKTHTGPIESEENMAYLRPETAQAIFVQFKNVYDSSRVKVPFGIGQIGKAFRNEITPRNFTFRSREFEQMELEFFIPPDEAIQLLHGSVAQWSEGADLSAPQPNWGWEMWHRYWVAQRTEFYSRIGLGADVLDYHWQKKEELAHYARACVDILFKFPFGTEELEGIAARGDFDLTQHQKHSGKSLEIFDEPLRAAATKLTDEQKKDFITEVQEDWNDHNKSREEAALFCAKLFKGVYVPHVIEPSAGLDRMTLAILCAGYHEEQTTDDKGKSETLVRLKFHPRVAPFKAGIFPLLKNKPELVKKAQAVRDLLRPWMSVFYDEGGSIGKRYARQDEIGTPFCVTIDFDTLGEKPELLDTVTIRYRDDGRQERLKISELLDFLLSKIR